MRSILATLAALALASAATGATAERYHVEYAFHGGAYGANPSSNLLEFQGGLYGTDNFGPESSGKVYAFDPVTGAITAVYKVDEAGYPGGDELTKFSSKLYGTIYFGGPQNDGVLFSLDPATGHEQQVYAFKGGADSCHPVGGLTKFKGLLYGATVGCGHPDDGDDGTVYSFDPATGVVALVYAFKGTPDGYGPSGDLTVVGSDLYGMTSSGGVSGACFLGCGTVFKVDPVTGGETVLHSFGLRDGQIPNGSLTKVGGMLYGTTSEGGVGDHGYGVIFSVNLATSAEKVLYAFGAGSDGGGPLGYLIQTGGSLYGVTESGGMANDGTVFSFDLKAGVEKVVHAFRGGHDGATPAAGLTYSRHRLYGTTGGGGRTNDGTIFSIKP